jgi:hypothetical protein
MKSKLSYFRAALAGACFATAGLASSAGAAIVYHVDQTIGSGSVVGTITTDGATGVLGVGDITAWNLELNGVGASFDLKSPNNSYVSGSDLTATPQYLYFNFSGVDGGRFLLQQGPEDGDTYYCDSTANNDCLKGASDVPVSYNDPSAQFSTPSGNQIIGTAAVPEPAAWSLLLVGLAGLGAAIRTRRRHHTNATSRSPRVSAVLVRCENPAESQHRQR